MEVLNHIVARICTLDVQNDLFTNSPKYLEGLIAIEDCEKNILLIKEELLTNLHKYNKSNQDRKSVV